MESSHSHTPQCGGAKLMIVGSILVINYLIFKINEWELLGILLIASGIVKLMMPKCFCHSMTEPPKKKK